MGESNYEMIRLDNLANGGAGELFDECLSKVVKNIVDPNTKAEAKRSITLKVEIKPKEDRNFCEFKISCVPGLAAAEPIDTYGFVGMDGDKAVASMHHMQQNKLPGMDGQGIVPTSDGDVDVETGEMIDKTDKVHRLHAGGK